ncbi:MAG: FtsX-like permease family protein [Chloroflexota bacterium]|nr:MAG: FtsX-like permease family protein [Chloroflexota bacterium]
MHLTLFKTILRDQLHRPWLTLLLILSVALGVAVVVAVDLANASATRAFQLSTEVIVGKATHQIVGGANGFDDSVYRNLRLQGFRNAAPIVEGYAGAKELGGQTMRVLGIDLFAEPPFRTYITAGTNVDVNALTAFYTQPGAVLISADSAARYNLKVGDTLTLQIGTQKKPVTIVGLMRQPNEVSSRVLEGLILTDIASAQELFGLDGKLTRIDLIATDEQANKIAAALPEGLRLVRASEQADTVTQLTAAFQLNLTAFSLLALAVGMFLIYNTVMFSVVQRRRMLGILRCVGVTGREIFLLIMSEAALLGLIGSLIGLGLGMLLGRLTVALVTQTINDLYFTLTVSDVNVDAFSLVKGLLLGISSALLAAALPAYEASAVPAVTVLQRSDLEDRIRRLLPRLNVIGAVLIVIGAAILIFGQSNVALLFGGIFIALFGLVLYVPVVTIFLMRIATATLGRFGLIARMASRTVTQALSRTSVAIASLMVAVAVVIGVTVMIASFRSTVENWLAQTLNADFYITTPLAGANRVVTMDPALVEKARAVEGVQNIEVLRSVTVRGLETGDLRLNATQGGVARESRIFRSYSGDPSKIYEQLNAGAIAITEPFANKHHVAEGDTLTLLTDKGAQSFPIVGVYYDYSSDQGSILMSLDVYRKFWNDPKISGFSVYVAPSYDVNQVEDAVRVALSGNDVTVQSNRALRDAALVIFDRTFAITRALQVIAIAVAFIGILSALMALQLERTRELGTLRATGMTLRQLWRLTLLESGLMGAAAGILAIPVGLVLAAILIYVINLRSFGWTIFFTSVPEVYVQALVVSIGAALIAAIYPMVRLSHLQVIEALREE